MNMLSTQEIFDKIIVHLSEQKVPARNENDCVYRTLDGRRCAVGGLIPEDKYDPIIEGISVVDAEELVDDLVVDLLSFESNKEGAKKLFAILFESGVDINEGKKVLLLHRCQEVHDNYAPASWPEHFAYIAEDLNLKFNKEKFAAELDI